MLFLTAIQGRDLSVDVLLAVRRSLSSRLRRWNQMAQDRDVLPGRIACIGGASHRISTAGLDMACSL